MVSKTVIVKNESGLHARPAGVLAKEAMKSKCEIFIHANEKKVNAKSLLAVMSSAIKCGTQIEVEVSGEDEEAELERIVSLIEGGLGE